MSGPVVEVDAGKREEFVFWSHMETSKNKPRRYSATRCLFLGLLMRPGEIHVRHHIIGDVRSIQRRCVSDEVRDRSRDPDQTHATGDGRRAVTSGTVETILDSLVK